MTLFQLWQFTYRGDGSERTWWGRGAIVPSSYFAEIEKRTGSDKQVIYYFHPLPPPIFEPSTASVNNIHYVITNQLKQSNEIMNDLVCDRKLGDRFLETKV